MISEHYTIKPHELSDAIYKAVRETIEEDYEILGQNVGKAARAARKSLATYRGHWIGFNRVGHDRGIYRKGWKVYNHRRNIRNGYVAATVANKNEPSLAHLIEFGHRLVRRGVVYGEVAPHPHFGEAEEAARRVLDNVSVEN